LVVVLGLLACRREPPPHTEDEHEAQQPSNRIAVPESVRRNLGLEFVKVERRRVAATLRVPGQFELLPAARREYRTPLPGRVEVLVQPLQEVQAGEVLYRIDSPQWRVVQRELNELSTEIAVLGSRRVAMQALVAAHHKHEASLLEAASVMEARVKSLEETRQSVGGQAPELAAARVQLAQVRADVAEASEKEAETRARVTEIEANEAAARERLALALEAAASLLGIGRDELAAPGRGSELPAWRTIGVVDVRAAAVGTVDALPVATGGWVEVGSLVAATADVRQLRFHGRGLQSDLGRLRSGLPAVVVAPQGSTALSERRAGELEVGVGADAAQRTVDLFVRPKGLASWARPGVAAFLEVETAAGGPAELSIPLSCVLRDGLQRVLFRRDPKSPDEVIRIEADLGVDDGRWVEVKSGLADGDEVVLAGAYELMLASSGSGEKGGHFHADGTFHSAKDGEGKGR
jgi:multidrug resistance efflux pump